MAKFLRESYSTEHGLCVNTRTRLRDQERAPIAADLKRSTREKAKVDDLTFALSADVTEAFVNTVGTFGIASASYYWSRVAGAIGRLLQYLSGHTSTSWHMLVADDYLLESGGPGYCCGLLLFFVLCAAVGVPLLWHKTCCGDTLVWVGFEILLESRHDAPSGLFGGRSKFRIFRQYRWRRLKRGWVSCSWPVRSNMNDLS